MENKNSTMKEIKEIAYNLFSEHSKLEAVIFGIDVAICNNSGRTVPNEALSGFVELAESISKNIQQIYERIEAVSQREF